MTMDFSYEEAFNRNFGLLSADDVARVRTARIGIAGMGGCGSNHVITLARMGFERFVIADPDVFEPANINRQAGAMVSTLGRAKVDVMQGMILDINPEAKVTVIREGLDEKSIPGFVSMTDIGINAIDFFRADLYVPYHDSYHAAGKYSIVGASPFAFGAAMTVIGPEGPTFSEFIGADVDERADTLLPKFVKAMTPDSFAEDYLPSGVNEIRSPLSETRISSSAAAIQLCAALTAAEVLFIITGRRPPTPVPEVLQIDLLLRRMLLSTTGGSQQRCR